VKNRFVNNILFRRSSHAKHKRVSIRFRADIDSPRVRETLDPRVVSVIHEFEDVAFEHARNVSPEASVSDCIKCHFAFIRAVHFHKSKNNIFSPFFLYKNRRFESEVQYENSRA
jgi:hypothetical protein